MKTYPVILKGKKTKKTAFRVPGDICIHGTLYMGDISKNSATFLESEGGEYSPIAEAKVNGSKKYRYSLVKFNHPGWVEGDRFTAESVPGGFVIKRC
jgi:hypothetical protein